MNVLKGFALGVLSFLLFLSLSMLCLAITLNYTILNPDFVTAEIDKLDISSLSEEFLSEETAQEEFSATLVDTITEIEPLLKEQVSAATYPIFDYLRGKSQNLDLSLVLGDTFLSPKFIASLLDKIDVSFLAREFLTEQLFKDIPKELEFVTEYVDDAVDKLEPVIKEELTAAADPISDYLLGKSQSFNIVISLEPAVESLKDDLRAAFLESPPLELAGLSMAQLEQYFNEYFREFTKIIPLTFEINESILGTEIPIQIAEALAEGEIALAQAKEYVDQFQLGYKVLIGFIVLVILGIILLNRQVRATTRNIGTTFLVVGAFGLAEIFFVSRFVLPKFVLPQIAQLGIAAWLQAWLSQLFTDFLAPWQMFSIGLAAGGVVLLIVSFVYRPRESTPESQSPTF